MGFFFGRGWNAVSGGRTLGRDRMGWRRVGSWARCILLVPEESTVSGLFLASK